MMRACRPSRRSRPDVHRLLAPRTLVARLAGQLPEMEMSEHRLSENEALRQELRTWLRENLPEGWSEQEYVPALLDTHEKARFELWWHKKLYEGGWAGAHWPREYSGRGLTTEQRRIY